MKKTDTNHFNNRLLNRSGLACAFTSLCLLASQASAQTYTYAGTDFADVVLDSSNLFTGASGEILNIGTTGDTTGPFGATATALVNDATINVFGTSSLQFLGTDNAARTQNLTVNFEDASSFLLNDVSHSFRQAVTINYNSSADSVSIGNLVFQSGGTGLPVINMNSGSVSIAGLNPSDKNGQVNLNGGNFNASGVNYTTGADLFNINFATGSSSIFTVVGAADINAFDTQFADGLFQINGVDAVKSDFSVAFDGSNLTVAIPEPSSFALLAGALALMAITLRRRK